MRSYFLMSIRLSRLIKLLIRNRGVSLRYVPRLIPLVFSGVVSEIFAVVEKVRFGRHLRSAPAAEPPVFIVSHWRTGSTLLHELMDLDDRFAAPTLLETIIPDHFLVASRYYRTVVAMATGEKRPIDNFAVTVDSANEHEFALLKMTGTSPLEKAVFLPRRADGYFLDAAVPFVPEGRDGKAFRRSFERFVAKIAYRSGRRPLLKNPWDSMRIRWLRELYPDAKFVHIRRNPEKTVPSTIRMWDRVIPDNLLKGRPGTLPVRDVTRFYLDMERTIATDLAGLPENDRVSIRYEDLIADPVGVLTGVYRTLGMELTPEHRSAIPRYMQDKSGNRSPSIPVRKEEIDEIRSVMSGYLMNNDPEIIEARGE